MSCQTVASLSVERKTFRSGAWQQDCGDGVGGIQEHVLPWRPARVPQASLLLAVRGPPCTTSLVEYSFGAPVSNKWSPPGQQVSCGLREEKLRQERPTE